MSRTPNKGINVCTECDEYKEDCICEEPSDPQEYREDYNPEDE